MNRGKRPSGKLAAARAWALPVIWLWRREPESPRVVVVYVDAATGAVMGTVPRAAITGKAVRALPAADGIPENLTRSPVTQTERGNERWQGTGGETSRSSAASARGSRTRRHGLISPSMRTRRTGS